MYDFNLLSTYSISMLQRTRAQIDIQLPRSCSGANSPRLTLGPARSQGFAKPKKIDEKPRSRTLNFNLLKLPKVTKNIFFGRRWLINCKMLSIDRFGRTSDSSSSGLPHHPRIFGNFAKKKFICPRWLIFIRVSSAPKFRYNSRLELTTVRLLAMFIGI